MIRDAEMAALPAPDQEHAGRTCPLAYRYPATVFSRAPEITCDVLYIVGGLYGNEPALDAVLDLFDREAGSKRMVFNGDFNWFDIQPDIFERLNSRVLQFDATRGNVETELGTSPDDSAGIGCGCAYPEWVGDGVVERSNRIMGRLRQTAAQFPEIAKRLAALPMHLRVDVGGRRVAIVHGDAESLAGWGFAQERLREPSHRQVARRWFDLAHVDIFASSHTCLPIFHTLVSPGRSFQPVVLNNGATGLPNFRHDQAGLLTRIAVRPFEGQQGLFGIVRDGLHLDAISVRADQHRWTSQFLAQWPAGSDAHVSYWNRIVDGPDFEAPEALVTSED